MEATNKTNTAFAIGGRIQVHRAPTKKEDMISIMRAIRHACKQLLICQLLSHRSCHKKKNLHISLRYCPTTGRTPNQKDWRYGIVEITVCIDNSCTSKPNVSAPDCYLKDFEGDQKGCEYCTSKT